MAARYVARAAVGNTLCGIRQPGPKAAKIGSAGRTGKTRAADARLVLRARRFSIRPLMRESGVGPHAVESFLRGGRVHPFTRARPAKAVEELEGRAKR